MAKDDDAPPFLDYATREVGGKKVISPFRIARWAGTLFAFAPLIVALLVILVVTLLRLIR